MENDALSLTDLVPVETLEDLRRLFKATVGVPMVFADPAGVAVTEVDDILLYCGTLVQDAEGYSICLRRPRWDVPEPDVEAKLRGKHGGDKPVMHRCMGGFRDTAVPIVVEGQTIGFAVFARSLTEPPDVQSFREMARHGGMDPEVGERVAQAAVVMPRERIAQVAEFLQIIANLVARAAYDTIRARQIMELEQLRDDLVHMIVHDLRTPLSGIMAGLETIVDADYEPDLTREFTSLALASSQRLAEMINTLLDINKMESGEMKLSKEEVVFADIAQEALDQVRAVAVERGQELTDDIDPHCPTILADGELLRRVIVNLLGNAVKFTPDGGRIKLATRCEDGALTFSVSDNGPGIPPEHHERIFRKFGQVEARKEGRRQSTGLGLVFCKMVAEAHGGRIRVDSEVGKGSTFTVSIPVRQPESGAA